MNEIAVYKQLSLDDTGEGAGHGSGILIPVKLASFFPLPGPTSRTTPTAAVTMIAELFIDSMRVDTVETQFRHHTKGGTRPAERKLSDGLSRIRNAATEDDFVIFRRLGEEIFHIQIELVKKGSTEHAQLKALAGSSRWGVFPQSAIVLANEKPKAADDVIRYIERISGMNRSPFTDERRLREETSVRIQRNKAFREVVLKAYGYQCAFTGGGIRSPKSTEIIGLDAAHIVPVSQKGSDHPSNGLALTKDMHWAFDQGLIGVDENSCIVVPKLVLDDPSGSQLRALNGKKISKTRNGNTDAHADAFAWHRSNVLLAEPN